MNFLIRILINGISAYYFVSFLPWWSIILIPFLLGYFIIDKGPVKVFACGCASSFLSMIAATYLNHLEAQTIINLDKE